MANKGDPRVHFVMNVVLSAVFVYIALWGLDLIGAVTFTTLRYLLGTAILVLITHLLVR
ncbi:MAG: hypothetical protein ACOCQ3_02780 [Natronomonas sp.]